MILILVLVAVATLAILKLAAVVAISWFVVFSPLLGWLALWALFTVLAILGVSIFAVAASRNR
jgi:hypothetical protein